MSEFSKKYILVVDDSRMSRMMIRAIIQVHRPDWTVLEAACGEDAIKLADQLPVDFASVDVNMPGIDGFELASIFKETHPKIRVCLLTANIQESSRRLAESLGVGFVKKPINEPSILHAIAFFEQA